MTRIAPNIASVILITVGCFALAGSSAAAVSSENAERWDFRVLLDDKEIGQHIIETDYTGDRQIVESTAQFDVKVLFINAFSYRHTAVERWQNNCLSELQSNTRANRKMTAVNGEKTDGELIVERFKNQGPKKSMQLDQENTFDGCVKTFAYWNPDILSAERLLNSQTGDYVDVEIQALGLETLNIDSVLVDARKYRIKSEEAYRGEPIDITLWYSKDSLHWLALESTAKGNRVIRYELQNAPKNKLLPNARSFSHTDKTVSVFNTF